MTTVIEAKLIGSVPAAHGKRVEVRANVRAVYLAIFAGEDATRPEVAVAFPRSGRRAKYLANFITEAVEEDAP